jgi:hypothetical protein
MLLLRSILLTRSSKAEPNARPPVRLRPLDGTGKLAEDLDNFIWNEQMQSSSLY